MPETQPTIFRAVNTQDDTVTDEPITDGATLDSTALGIIADPGMSVGSASFYIDGEFVRTENVAPYALFGDQNGDFFAGNLALGDHMLEVVFHEGSSGSGAVLTSEQIAFAVSDGTDDDTPDTDDPGTDTPDTDPDVFPSGEGAVDPNGLAAWADQILFHFDGNNNDEDDIAAIPVAALLAASAGIADKMTFFYGNNIAERNNDSRLSVLDESAAFANGLGVATVDYQDDIAAATAGVVELLTSGQKILAIEGGPMEAIYRALEQTDVQFHSNIKLLSHSSWNENRDVVNRDGVEEARTWADIASDFPNVEQVDIQDQNAGNNNDQGFNNNGWSALDSSDDPTLSAARDAMNGAAINGNNAKPNDPSDAGMLWFAITGEQDGTPEDALSYIEGSGLLDDLPPETEPEPELLTLASDHQSPLSEATYDPDTGVLDLLFNYDRLLDVNGEWSDGRHIDAVTVNGTAYPIIIHDDDGPRDANGQYIFNEDTVNNTFSLNIGAGLDPADGTLEFGLTDREDGTGLLYEFTLVPAGEDPTPADPSGLVLAVNAGGAEFTAANGLVYEADNFENGRSFSTNADISGTENDGLYQSERWQSDGFTYDIAVENGSYDLELNFAEIWSGAQSAGGRVFDISVEDKIVFSGLDVADEVGFNAALDLVGEVDVTDGSLTITMLSDVQNPKLSGFSVWDAEGDLSETFIVGSITDDVDLL